MHFMIHFDVIVSMWNDGVDVMVYEDESEFTLITLAL